MSPLEVPPPDVLAGEPEPYSGFGPPQGHAVNDDFLRVVDGARHRVQETFEAVDVEGRPGVETIERVIREMWDEGWDPEQGDVNLFTRDFGSLFMACLSNALGGERIFRSMTDLSHASVFWRKKRLEAFPFHKVYKRLSNREGDSLVFFFDSLKQRVSPN